MNKIYAVFPDGFKNSMSVHPMIKPEEKLRSLGVSCFEQEQFFASVIEGVKPTDVVILWIGLKDDQRIEKFAKLDCKKHLRNVDSCSSDRILFKRELELSKRIKFDSFLITYCTDYNLKFLAEKGIRTIKYPHLLDFSKTYTNDKKDNDIFLSGQMSLESYPLRTRLAKLMFERGCFKYSFLPHPGHKTFEVRHDLYGEKYIECASHSSLSSVCTGDDDSLVMKYLEFAKAGTLPIGDVPTNMPPSAKDAMIVIGHGMTDNEILVSIQNILQNKNELKEKTRTYQNVMKENFDIKKTVNILEKIIREDYDA
jgi:hypothetical protein